MATKRTKRPAQKTSGKRAAMNPPAGSQRPGKGTPGHEQDIQRRLGNFTGKGEHAVVGGRTTGIVGQTTKDFTTDKKRIKATKPRTKHGKGSR
jgi:hypothetical protein